MTQNLRALGDQLMNQISEDSRDWANTTKEWKLAPVLKPVVAEIEQMIGKSDVRLAVGVIAHDITEWHEAAETRIREGVSVDEIEMEPWWPNSYEITVVTDKLIARTWGVIPRERNSAPHEPIEVTAMRYLSSVTKELSLGEMQNYGEIATHSHLSLGFAAGAEVSLPGSEECLTPKGSERLEALIPDLYDVLAG